MGQRLTLVWLTRVHERMPWCSDSCLSDQASLLRIGQRRFYLVRCERCHKGASYKWADSIRILQALRAEVFDMKDPLAASTQIH